MPNQTFLDLADRYWQHYSVADSAHPDQAAMIRMAGIRSDIGDEIEIGGDHAIDLVKTFVDTAPNQEALQIVGTHLIEDLFHQLDDDAPIDELITAMRTDQRMRDAFQGSWMRAVPEDQRVKFAEFFR